jgi:uncharacterized membrane protein
MAHAHGHAEAGGPVPPVIRRRLLFAVLPFAIATLVGLLVLWPAHAHPKTTRTLGPAAQLVNARVADVSTAKCAQGGGGPGLCQTVYLRITSGPDKGQTSLLPDVALGPGVPLLRGGDKIVVGRSASPGSTQVDYYFADYQRRVPLAALALLFAVAVIAVARIRGLAALVGLAVAWLILVRFVIPAILAGESPVAVALVGGALILFVVLYLAHGLNARTTTALLGTLASLALTGALAAGFVAAAHLTGLSSEEATYLQTLTTKVSLSGLVLGGIIIGSLGVLNDITVTQASSVWEIHAADPRRSPLELYRSAMRVGRDHIASVVYTLVLAYAGASLPLLILFTLSNQSAGNILSGDLVAEEIVRTAVGSIGLVASVPITTALAAFVVSRRGITTESEETPQI